MRVLIAPLLAIGLAGAGPPQNASAPPPSLQAAEPAPPATPVSGVVVIARRPTHVGEVTVTGTTWCPDPDPVRHPSARAPSVADSYPEPGGVIAPGYALVRVTFDAPMSCYSEVTVDGGDGDPCEASGTWELPDRRSWIMQCRLAPSTGYKISFRKSEGAGFVGLSGRTAEPYELAFRTSPGPATASPLAAQAADPGPPGQTRTAAYVTCADPGRAAVGHDCSHEVFRNPER